MKTKDHRLKEDRHRRLFICFCLLNSSNLKSYKMNRTKLILVTILFAVVAESRGQRQAVNSDVITINVTKNYPKKELILQDFMDVEYIALETNYDFVNQGWVQDIGKKFIVVTNINHDGDIFVYDRTGKALRKINRKGYGGEEYTDIISITLDEDNEEMFVSDPFTGKILVYNLYGKFKRSFKQKTSSDFKFFKNISNYDKTHLICGDEHSKETTFVLLSKQDGSIAKEIKIPFKKKIVLGQTLKGKEDRNITGSPRGGYTTTGTVTYQIVVPGPYRTMTNFNSNWILVEYSSDTVYTYSPDYSLRPLLIRTPSIQSMNPGVFLMLSFFTDRYYFLQTMTNVYEEGFPETNLMYDRQEKAFYGYTVYNGDYSTKKEIHMNYIRGYHEDQSWHSFEAYQLVEDYKRGILKGRLKEIVAKLDEEDNRVVMLIKHKK